MSAEVPTIRIDDYEVANARLKRFTDATAYLTVAEPPVDA